MSATTQNQPVVVLPVIYDAALLQWHAATQMAPRWSLAYIGRWLLVIGGGAILAGMFFTPPWVKFGVFSGIAGLLLTRSPVLKHPLMWVGIAYSAWIVIGMLVNVIGQRPGAERLPGTAYTWVALPVVACAALDHTWRIWVIRLTIVAGSIAGIVGALQFFIGYGTGMLSINPEGIRLGIVKGFSSFYLSFGFINGLLALLCCLPGSAIAAGGAWLWAGRIIAIIGGILCGSRAIALAFAVGVGVVVACRGRRFVIYGGLAALLLCAAIFGRMAATDSTQKIQRMFDGNEGRFVIWRYSAQVIADNPVFGVGGRKAFTPEYNVRYLVDHQPTDGDFDTPHAHNWFIAAAAEHGLPTAILHFLFVIGVTVFCWQRRKQSVAAFCLSMGATALAMVGGLFEPFAVHAVSGLAFHGVLGLAVGLAIAPKTDENPVAPELPATVPSESVSLPAAS